MTTLGSGMEMGGYTWPILGRLTVLSILWYMTLLKEMLLFGGRDFSGGIHGR